VLNFKDTFTLRNNGKEIFYRGVPFDGKAVVDYIIAMVEDSQNLFDETFAKTEDTL
jgi:hypothetical protein